MIFFHVWHLYCMSFFLSSQLLIISTISLTQSWTLTLSSLFSRIAAVFSCSFTSMLLGLLQFASFQWRASHLTRVLLGGCGKTTGGDTVEEQQGQGEERQGQCKEQQRHGQGEERLRAANFRRSSFNSGAERHTKKVCVRWPRVFKAPPLKNILKSSKILI